MEIWEEGKRERGRKLENVMAEYERRGGKYVEGKR